MGPILYALFIRPLYKITKVTTAADDNYVIKSNKPPTDYGPTSKNVKEVQNLVNPTTPPGPHPGQLYLRSKPIKEKANSILSWKKSASRPTLQTYKRPQKSLTTTNIVQKKLKENVNNQEQSIQHIHKTLLNNIPPYSTTWSS